MEKPTLSPQEENIAKEMYSRLNGLQPERKKEILAYIGCVFKEDVRAKVLSLQREADRLSKI